MLDKKIIILARDGVATRLLVQVLMKHYSDVTVILENAPSKKQVMTNRAKKIGWSKVLGQLAFLALVVPFIKNNSRIQEIIKSSGLNGNFNFLNEPIRVNSANDEGTIAQILKINPDIIYVNGTRILSKNFLSKLKIPIINIHVGITPKYRGIHGGYWAVKNNDLDNFGVTIHTVDEGVDTGAIIKQIKLKPTSTDNYSSYSMLQYVAALQELDRMIWNNPEFYLKTIDASNLPSKQYYHPTIWQYLF